jgi:hypothetical protein
MAKKIEVLGSSFRHHVVLFALNRVVVDGGNNITLISNSEEVALTLERTSRVNSGYWNCSAQVYDTDSLKVGKPVEKTVQLVIVVPPVAPVNLSVKEIGATWIYLQ